MLLLPGAWLPAASLSRWLQPAACRCPPAAAGPCPVAACLPRPAALDAGRRSGRASAPGRWPAALPARSSRRHRRSRSSRRLERACRGEGGGPKGTGPLGSGELLWPFEVGSIGLIVWPMGLVETGREATGKRVLGQNTLNQSILLLFAILQCIHIIYMYIYKNFCSK